MKNFIIRTFNDVYTRSF